MDESEGVLSFDFEGGLDAAHVPSIPSSAPGGPLISSDPSFPTSSVNPNPSMAPTAPSDLSGAVGNAPLMPGRRSFRQTVCRHWLRGLCMKGEACGFLHQYDKARMPVCRFFRLYGECREQDCVYKHTNEDIKECNMYKLGFCPNGPDCRYRHAKLPGPPPLVEEVFQKIQHLSSFNYNPSNRFFQQRSTCYNQTAEKPQFPLTNGPAIAEVTGKTSAGMELTSIPQPQTLPPSHPSPVQQPLQQVDQNQMQNHSNGFTNQAIKTAVPLPPGRSRYFIVKSCNRENLELSVQQGVWATQRSNEAKLNEAFETTENVVLIFSINRTRHFQGCAKMTSKIGGYVGGGNWKYAHGTPHYGRNFSIKWLKLGELSFHKTRHLRNPYNDNLPVKISRDCQELDPFVGPQLANLLYDEPDSELWAMLVAAESKREEEKVKGVSPDDVTGNPDIVPFDDNEEEEEEEESEEEEEEEEENIGVGSQMRGRGRGVMWPPHMPMVPGGRPMIGVRGFPPVMMGPDGFSFGGVSPDGFTAPDLFGPRMFAPYGGPRFPGDLSGLVFPGRPTQPGAIFAGGGLGMMMGANGAPFMGGMAIGGPNAARPNRPLGMQPFRMPPPPLPPSGRASKRDQRRTGNDRGDRYESGPDQINKSMDNTVQAVDNRYQIVSRTHYDDSSGLRNNFHNDESESEDEAPRRSRKRESNEETASDR